MSVLLTLLGASHLGAILSPDEARTVNTLLNVCGIVIPAVLLFLTNRQNARLKHIEKMAEINREESRQAKVSPRTHGRRKSDKPIEIEDGDAS